MTDAEDQTDPVKLMLVTPPQFELNSFAGVLDTVYAAAEITCLRLGLATRDEDELARAADVLREVSHARDIPVIIDDHYRMVERIGLDGVHLTDGPRRVRDVRKLLGQDAIVGAFCGASRHAGMTAGELGTDYISFGPLSVASLLGEDETAPADLFAWWAEMIEVPVVAEGGLSPDALAGVLPHTDFICLGDEIWSAPEGVLDALGRFTALL